MTTPQIDPVQQPQQTVVTTTYMDPVQQPQQTVVTTTYMDPVQQPQHTVMTTPQIDPVQQPQQTVVTTTYMDPVQQPQQTLVTTTQIDQVQQPQNTVVTTTQMDPVQQPQQTLVTTTQTDPVQQPQNTVVTTTQMDPVQQPQQTLVTTTQTDPVQQPQNTVVTTTQMDPVQQSQHMVVTTTQMDPVQQPQNTVVTTTQMDPVQKSQHTVGSNTQMNPIQPQHVVVKTQMGPVQEPQQIAVSTTQMDPVQQTDQQPIVIGGQTRHPTKVVYTQLGTGHQSQQVSNSDANIQPIPRSQAPSGICTPVSTEGNTVTAPLVQTTARDMDIVRLPNTLTEGESNFLKFCHLVQKVAPQAVRYRFDQEFPPDQLNAIIQRNMTLLKSLKDKRVLTKAQWKLILPYGAKVTSTNFDVTLMVCFFRHLSSITPQYCDYDTLPPPSDESLGADLARVKYYRNYIAHCLEKDRKFDIFEYPICWETVSKAVSRIGGHRYEMECSNLLVGTLDQSYMEVYRNFQMEIAELTEKLQDPLPPNMREMLCM